MAGDVRNFADRDLDETLVGGLRVETVSRQRCRDYNHIPG